MRPVRVLLLIVGAGLLTASAAFADYAESYKQGVLAADEKRWAEVARLMEAAIAERATEGGPTIRLYGTRRVPYVPNFFLGMARLELGDRAGALAAFEEAAKQGVTASQGAGLGFAKQLDQYLASLADERGRGRVEEIYRQADGSLGQARVLAKNLADRRPEAAVRSLLARDPALDRRWKDLESSLAEVARALEAGRTGKDLAATQAAAKRVETTLAELRDLEQAVQAGSAVEVAPAELVQAARAYFNGSYSTAIDLLSGARFGDRGAALQANLILAAARFNLYRASKQADDGLLRQARAAVAECRRIDPAYRPDGRYFSASFRALFEG